MLASSLPNWSLSGFSLSTSLRDALAQARQAVQQTLLRPMELRIDVTDRPDAEVQAELDGLYERLYAAGDRLNGLEAQPLPQPHLQTRIRHVDGETFVYVEDVAQQRLAGYTLFKRLVELNRRADRHLRAPHSRFDTDYQRRGICTALYSQQLDAGQCLISGARQSAGAHALWRALARRYPMHGVSLRDKQLYYLGPGLPKDRLDDLDTRLLLLGKGWSLPALMQATGMREEAAEEI